MTTTHSVGAISELDQLGQGALDAIFAEHEAMPDPAILQMIEDAGDDPDDDTIREVMDKVGGIGSMLDVAIRAHRASVEREHAVERYVVARRVLTRAGVL